MNTALAVGDQILFVNGQEASELSHAELVAILGGGDSGSGGGGDSGSGGGGDSGSGGGGGGVAEIVVRSCTSDTETDVNAIKSLLQRGMPAHTFVQGVDFEWLTVGRDPSRPGARVVAARTTDGAPLHFGDIVCAVNGVDVLDWPVEALEQAIAAPGCSCVSITGDVADQYLLRAREVHVPPLGGGRLGVDLATAAGQLGARVVGVAPNTAGSKLVGIEIGCRITAISWGKQVVACTDLKHEEVVRTLSLAKAAPAGFTLRVEDDRSTLPVVEGYTARAGASVAQPAAMAPSGGSGGDPDTDDEEAAAVFATTQPEATAVAAEVSTLKRVVVSRAPGQKLGLNLENVAAPIQVAAVAEGGAAAATGRFDENDIVLEVNGADCRGATLAEVTALIKNAGPTVVFVLQPCEKKLAIRTAMLTKEAGSFGIHLVQASSGTAGATACRVLRKFAGSAAGSDPAIQIGDDLIGINGTAVSEMTIAEITAMLGGLDVATLNLRASETPIARAVRLVKADGEKLGMSISDFQGAPGIFIQTVVPGGLAAKSNMVLEGDRVIVLNGMEASETTINSATKSLIRAAVVDMVLLHDPSLIAAAPLAAAAATPTSASQAADGYIDIVG
jgi:hypothetical protein